MSGVLSAEQLAALDAWLREGLKESRYTHSLGTAETARRLAVAHGLDADAAYEAGLLHDCGRIYDKEAQLPYAAQWPQLEPGELDVPMLRHGPAGAVLLRDMWGIDDRQLLDAVAGHTLARRGMSDFTKLVFLADLIEPNREPWDGIEKLRLVAEQDLNRAMALAIRENQQYLQRQGREEHPAAAAALQEIEELINKEDKA